MTCIQCCMDMLTQVFDKYKDPIAASVYHWIHCKIFKALLVVETIDNKAYNDLCAVFSRYVIEQLDI